MPFPAGNATNPGQFVHPVMQVQYRLWPRTREATTGPQNWADMEFPASGKAEGSGRYEHAHLAADRSSHWCRRCADERTLLQMAAALAGPAPGPLAFPDAQVDDPERPHDSVTHPDNPELHAHLARNAPAAGHREIPENAGAA
jgi:hypothetical protein